MITVGRPPFSDGDIMADAHVSLAADPTYTLAKQMTP